MTVTNPHRVLIVEDEFFLADDLRRALEREAVIVVGPIGTEAGSLALLKDVPVDCAILDINLHGKMVYPLARALSQRDVPFLFVTGYDSIEVEEGFGDVDLIQNPVSTEALMQGINRLTDNATRSY